MVLRSRVKGEVSGLRFELLLLTVGIGTCFSCVACYRDSLVHLVSV